VSATGTLTLWRPTGPSEWDLVVASGFRRWPPRLPERPIFYPVLNEDYAVRIARDWNASRSRGSSGSLGVCPDLVTALPVSRWAFHTLSMRKALAPLPASEIAATMDELESLIRESSGGRVELARRSIDGGRVLDTSVVPTNARARPMSIVAEQVLIVGVGGPWRSREFGYDERSKEKARLLITDVIDGRPIGATALDRWLERRRGLEAY